jgi:hypothetical protein
MDTIEKHVKDEQEYLGKSVMTAQVRLTQFNLDNIKDIEEHLRKLYGSKITRSDVIRHALTVCAASYDPRFPTAKIKDKTNNG